MEIKKEKYFDYYTNQEKETNVIIGSKTEFLEERNKTYMNYTALSTENNQKITFEELHTRIEEYARALYKRGIRKGDKIGVCLVNTPEAVYTLYALDKIGAEIIGLSPLNNEYKMRRDIEMAHPKMIITVDMLYKKSKKACDTLNISPILYSPLESLDNPFIKTYYNVIQFIKGNKLFGYEHNLNSIVKNGKTSEYEKQNYTAGEISDILFTGGSTGVHKGVQLTSDGLNGVVQGVDDVFVLEPGMKHLGNIPFGHMVFGRFVLQYALANNLEYCLTLKALPQDFLKEIIRTQCEGAMGGPVHWINLINNPLVHKRCSRLIQAISGGEKLKPEDRKNVHKEFQKMGLDIELGDGLGLTEMWAPTHINMGKKNTPGTIGYPIGFVKSKVINPKMVENIVPGTKINLEEVSIGQDGLLLVNGPGMMKGYLNNKEETDKVFYYDLNGTKWYNTGDMVKRTGINNNEYQFTGRKKRNFVCGISNIYPEQIEELITQLPEIKNAIVTSVPDEKYQFLPVYHIQLINEEIDKEVLKSKIDVLIEKTLGADALPGYILYTLDDFAKTDNGKLNNPLSEQYALEKFNNNELKLVKKKY